MLVNAPQSSVEVVVGVAGERMLSTDLPWSIGRVAPAHALEVQVITADEIGEPRDGIESHWVTELDGAVPVVVVATKLDDAVGQLQLVNREFGALATVGADDFDGLGPQTHAVGDAVSDELALSRPGVLVVERGLFHLFVVFEIPLVEGSHLFFRVRASTMRTSASEQIQMDSTEAMAKMASATSWYCE